jgi:HEPN domain-containing protein
MPPDPAPLPVILRWMRSARSDLAWARAPVPPEGDREQACFHAQQAVEKAVKTLLLSLGNDFPFTHNLQRLVGLLPADLRADPVILASTRLTDYAVHARYPGEDDPVDE